MAQAGSVLGQPGLSLSGQSSEAQEISYLDAGQRPIILAGWSKDEVLAEGHTIPVAWDGTDADLGPGIDAAITAGFALRAAGGGPTCLCALAAEIPARHRGRHLSGVLVRAMSGLAREAELNRLIAPVRPSLKDHYPTIPLERYIRWTRPDGSPFDPWIRVHTLLGAPLGPVIPRSLHITGTVAEWESWTQMRFPETGGYVFPAGLATVRIDCDRDLGEYWEPSIWIIHPPSPVTQRSSLRQMRVFPAQGAMDSYAGSSAHPRACSQAHVQAVATTRQNRRCIAPSKRLWLARRVRLTKPAGFRQLSSLSGS